jgi:hypothetical protein
MRMRTRGLKPTPNVNLRRTNADSNGAVIHCRTLYRPGAKVGSTSKRFAFAYRHESAFNFRVLSHGSGYRLAPNL